MNPDNTKLRVLVTGATGFLGSHILRSLRSHEHIELIAACRNQNALPKDYRGETRIGDLRHSDYRSSLVSNVDVICHAGTWAALWGHARQEEENFFLPSIDLINQAIRAGVKRFLLSSTVVLATPQNAGPAIDDFAHSQPTTYWPHLDRLIEIDHYMQSQQHRGMQMITMRLGHFIGPGNRLGLLPILLPRLNTHLVPWLAGGHARLPLISGEDLGRAFAAVATAKHSTFNTYESFNVTADTFPSMREVLTFLHQQAGSPLPKFSVPFSAGYAFAWLMEKLYPLTGANAPFLARSIIRLSHDWYCPSDYLFQKTGFRAQQNWQDVLNAALTEIQQQGISWPAMKQGD